MMNESLPRREKSETADDRRPIEALQSGWFVHFATMDETRQKELPMS
jgi:hypothetical protein